MTTDVTSSSPPPVLPQVQLQQRSAAPDSAQRLAWQREMERAQGESWFKKPLPEHAGRGGVHPSSNAPRPERTSEQVPNRASTLAAMAATGEQRPLTAPSPTTAVDGRAAFAPRVDVATASAERNSSMRPSSASRHDLFRNGEPALAVPMVQSDIGVRPQLTHGSEHSRSALAGSQSVHGSGEPPATGRREPIRWHLQWDGGHARVWFGLDAEHAQHATQLAGQVQRWLEAQGIRVRSLVCNGKPVFDHPVTAPAESSAQHSLSFMPTPSGKAPERFDSFFDLIATKET